MDPSPTIDCYIGRCDEVGIGIQDTVVHDEPFLPVDEYEYNAALFDTKVLDLLPQALSTWPFLPLEDDSIVRL